RRIVSKGRNQTNETQNASLHAKFDALSSLLPNHQNRQPKTNFNQITLYVTVEPCLMCLSALQQIGPKKVF
ncbi:cytidine deaminase-like protein, partial [Melampsora americana]